MTRATLFTGSLTKDNLFFKITIQGTWGWAIVPFSKYFFLVLIGDLNKIIMGHPAFIGMNVLYRKRTFLVRKHVFRGLTLGRLPYFTIFKD